jgi:hypothetical protein
VKRHRLDLIPREDDSQDRPTPKASDAAPLFARAAADLAIELSTASQLNEEIPELRAMKSRVKAFSCLFLAWPEGLPSVEERRATIAAFGVLEAEARGLIALIASSPRASS